MPEKHQKTLRQLNIEAERYAKFNFDPEEQRRWRESVGKAGSTAYAVVVANRFVPLDTFPESVPVLRRYARGVNLDAPEWPTLKDYWHRIDESLKRLHSMLVDGAPIRTVEATAAALATWPAVGVAESEGALRSLLALQFERIRQKRISFDLADGVHPFATRDGMYLLVDWARHG